MATPRPAPTVEEMEQLAVDLMMKEGVEHLRSVQRECCAALLTSHGRDNVLVKAVMGCGKTLAMVVSILTEQERRLRVGQPMPVCCIVVRQKEVERTLVRACERGLLNHDIFSDLKSDEVYTAWVRDAMGDGAFQAVDFNFEDEIRQDPDGWELGLHQGPTPPDLRGRVEGAHAALANEVHRQRLFLGNPKRRRLTEKSFEPYRRPVIKEFEELPRRAAGRGATIVVTYNSLQKVLEACDEGLVLNLVLVDESHVVANNTHSTTWKAAVTQLCRSAERVMMFTGTPIRRDGRGDPTHFLELFRSGAQRITWSEIDALAAREIVPCEVVLGDATAFQDFLRNGERGRAVWADVLAAYQAQSAQFRGNPPAKLSETDVVVLVFTLVRMAALHAEYRADPEAAVHSPCANVLVESPGNDVGLAMHWLLLHLTQDAAVREAWLVPLLTQFGRGADAVACVEALRDTLRTSCPNGRLQARKRFIEGMSAWEAEGRFNILIASKWPFEGTDMPHLHAVVPYPKARRQDNIFDQMRARPCRAVPRKKRGYLFMLNARRLGPLPGSDAEDAEDAEKESRSSSSASGVSGARARQRLPPDAADAEDCRGVGLNYLAAVALAAATGGGIRPCPLLMAEAPAAHRKLMAKLHASRQAAKRELRWWEECARFGDFEQRGPFALVVLFEYGAKVVVGLLTRRTPVQPPFSHLYVEFVEILDRLPSREEAVAAVQPALDGTRHGFRWEGDRLKHGDQYLSFRCAAQPPRGVAPLELSEQPPEHGAVARKAYKEFYGGLANFDGLAQAFLLGSPDLVLELTLRCLHDGNLAFSMSPKVSVRHLFLQAPLDLAQRPAVPLLPARLKPERHKQLANQIFWERASKTTARRQAMPYLSDVVLLALVHVDGGSHGLVECNPAERKYGRLLQRARLDVLATDYMTTCVWQLEEVDILTDQFRICRDGLGWVCPTAEDSNGTAMALGASPSTFTRHGLPKTSCFELACGRHRTRGFVLVTEGVPLGMRIQRSVGDSQWIYRSDDRPTQWFCFPHAWLRECSEVRVEPVAARTPAASPPCGYDAAHFSEAKHAGKDKVNRFLREIAVRRDGRALLLDDLDPRTGQLRSTAALDEVFPLGAIIVPNPDEAIAQLAGRMGATGVAKTWEDALNDLPAEPTLGLAFYDNCDQGDWSVTERNLQKACPHLLPGGVLACTLLGRNVAGDSAAERTLRCNELLLGHGFEHLACIKYEANHVLFYRKRL